ncbi:MAG: SHOCT domain-containing protein [Anaerolineae bacterium]
MAHVGRIEAAFLLLIGLFIVAVLVVVVLGLLFWLRRHSAGRAPGDATEPTARQILDAHYARGELDRDEYLRMRRELAEPGETPSRV